MTGLFFLGRSVSNKDDHVGCFFISISMDYLNSPIDGFGHESFGPGVDSAGSFRPGSFRPDFRVGRFGLFWRVVSARYTPTPPPPPPIYDKGNFSSFYRCKFFYCFGILASYT